MVREKLARRAFLGATAAAASAAAGCGGSNPAPSPTAGPTTRTTVSVGDTTEATDTRRPGTLRVTGLSVSPETVGQAEPFTVTAELRNAGDEPVSAELVAVIDPERDGRTATAALWETEFVRIGGLFGDLVRRRRVTLGGGETANVSFRLEEGYPGTHTVSVGDRATTFEVTRRPNRFIARTGRHFTVNGRAFYFNGTNNQFIYKRPTWVVPFFRAVAEQGMNVVRLECLIGRNGDDANLQSGPGTYNESGFRRLDYAFYRAKQYGVRIVLVLVDYWPYYTGTGGMQAYVDWSSTVGSYEDERREREQFYTDPDAQQAFRGFVEYLLTRRNVFTGVEYRHDPTLFLLELTNEAKAARIENGHEVFRSWIADTAEFIKGIDSNHLVSTGITGRYDSDQPWYNRGPPSLGTDFIADHQPAAIDACSFHQYSPLDDPRETAPFQCETHAECNERIRVHCEDAHGTVGKPVYLGEFGHSVDRTAPDADAQLAARAETFRQRYEALAAADADGAMFWAFWPEQMVEHLRRREELGASAWRHNVYPDESGTMAAVARYSKRVERKSGRPVDGS